VSFARYRCSSVLFAVVTLALRPLIGCAESSPASDLADASAPPTQQLPVDAGFVDASEPALDASPPTDASPCSASGFCVEPISVQKPLLAVSGTNMNDAWAIASNAILRWDGISWRTMYQSDDVLPGTGTLFGLSATKHDDLWAIGTRVLVRYSARDGNAPAFREYPISTSSNTALTTAASYWVSPTSDELWIFDDFVATTGVRYREVPGGTLVRERISDPPIGFPWVQSDASFLVRSIFGFASDDIYVGGAWCTSGCSSAPAWTDFDGAIAHYDGSSWSMVTTLAKGECVSKIYATMADNGTRQLWIWTGIDGWSSPFSPGKYSIRLLSQPEDGAAPTTVFDYPITFAGRLIGPAPPSNGAWFSNQYLLYRWNGVGLDVTPTAINGVPMGTINGIWAPNEDEAWIVGESPRRSEYDAPRGFAARRTRSAP